MFVNPNVQRAGASLRAAPYSNAALQHQLLKEYVETCLADAKQAPALLAGGSLSIGMRLRILPRKVVNLPSGLQVSEWLTDFAWLNDLDSVSMVMQLTGWTVGKAQGGWANTYFLSTCSKDLGETLFNFWTISKSSDGTVLNWSPVETTEDMRIAGRWLKVF